MMLWLCLLVGLVISQRREEQLHPLLHHDRCITRHKSATAASTGNVAATCTKHTKKDGERKHGDQAEDLPSRCSCQVADELFLHAFRVGLVHCAQ